MTKSLSEISQEIWEDEFFEDSSFGMSQSSILSWIENNVGKLNISLHTNFEPSDSDDSVFDLGASDVLKMMYVSRYYSNASRKVLRGIMDGSISAIISVKDDDTTIIKSNKSEIGKTLRNISMDYNSDLKELIHQYKIHHVIPQQILGLSSISHLKK